MRNPPPNTEVQDISETQFREYQAIARIIDNTEKENLYDNRTHQYLKKIKDLKIIFKNLEKEKEQFEINQYLANINLEELELKYKNLEKENQDLQTKIKFLTKNIEDKLTLFN